MLPDRRRTAPEISDEIKQNYSRRRIDRSAGGVAYRRVAGGLIEVALIATRGGTRWQLPKGTKEPGERSIETAIREVEEEVGLQTVWQADLPTIEYGDWDTYRKPEPELVHKLVDFFLLAVVGGSLSDASYEVDGVGWFAATHALELLTFSGEQAVVAAAIALIA